jgi:hypothetical protein
LGQELVFETGSELLKTLTGQSISGKQIERISEYYGGKLEEQSKEIANGTTDAPQIKLKEANHVVYVMIDGSMLLTRDGWKEIKVARIFNHQSMTQIQDKRNIIMESFYLCHLGGIEKFLLKLESYIDNYKHLVFIGDGAPWIWKWVKDYSPKSTQILDLFHALEKLGVFASARYKDTQEREMWIENQRALLESDQVEKVIENLEKDISVNKEVIKLKNDVIRYYITNKTRMMYKTYSDSGYLVGSGAIESAHRNVVQQRMKLSGQRWSIKGAQKIANLRACKKSMLWANVVKFIKIAV